MQFLNSNIEIVGFTSNSTILFKSVCELVENAIDACKDKDEGLVKIVIENTKTKNYYKLTVTDNGKFSQQYSVNRSWNESHKRNQAVYNSFSII